MPESDQFLRGFGLIPQSKFGIFTLLKSSATHEVIRRYQEYRYNITLVFDKNVNVDNLKSALLPTLQQQHIIYGVRNPYLCVIDYNHINIKQTNIDTSIFFTGHSYRN